LIDFKLTLGWPIEIIKKVRRLKLILPIFVFSALPMFHQNHKFKRLIKPIALLLVSVFGLHVLSAHAITDNLVYCFEENGDVNIESKSDFVFGFNSEQKVHDVNNHQHEGAEYHAAPESHKDVEILNTHIKDTRNSRFDLDSTLGFLAFQNNQVDSYLPNSALKQTHSFTPSLAEFQSTLSLKTVVLLN